MARLSGRNLDEIRGKMPAPVYEAYLQFRRALWEQGQIEIPLKEMVRLKCAQVNDCRPWILGRVAEAQQQGLTEERLAKVADYEASDLTEREKLALQFTELLILDPRAADDAFFTRLKRHFTEGEIVELAFTVMLYSGLNRFNIAIDLEPLNPNGLAVASELGASRRVHQPVARQSR